MRLSIWDFLVTYWPRLLNGTGTTLALFGLAALVAITAALIAGLAQLSRHMIVRGLATCYVELFRGTSLLVQLYWIFFVLPLFGIQMPKFTAGFLSVGLNIGAYGAVIVRGAILAVPRGQWEASYALSMSPAQRMRRIILPQAFLAMLPPWGNLLIELLKGTALVAMIAVADLMFEVRQINASTFLSAQAFGTALVIYYLLARFIITPTIRLLERIMARRLGRA